ncbi:hypothetical protein D6D01_06072 [Aureobasidium pullulans]|uniref:Uncharacterized protein n=1 Tax=Aureobasidium pullulans TaxID=5580 RepID=A0A4S9L279_AURPU|nr:hypothetical protein D6D01_06072 [Aureobasidium pullulans]
MPVRQQINKFFYQLGIKLRWMLVTLIAPELLCGVAAEEWLNACKAARILAEKPDDEIEWTASHGFFAQMGGFRLRFRDADSQNSRRTSNTTTNEASPKKHGIAAPYQEPLLSRLSYSHANNWSYVSGTSSTVESQEGLLPSPVNVAIREKSFKSVVWDLNIMSKQHAGLSTSFGPAEWSPDTRNGALIEQMMVQRQTDPQAGEIALMAMRMTTDTWNLSLEQIRLARKYGIIKTLPSMSKEDLDAISNSDGLAKALAVCQVLWLIIQMISRATSSLSVCQLEVATGAFAITTFLTRSLGASAVWTRGDKFTALSRPELEAVTRASEGKSLLQYNNAGLCDSTWSGSLRGLEFRVPRRSREVGMERLRFGVDDATSVSTGVA